MERFHRGFSGIKFSGGNLWIYTYVICMLLLFKEKKVKSIIFLIIIVQLTLFNLIENEFY